MMVAPPSLLFKSQRLGKKEAVKVSDLWCNIQMLMSFCWGVLVRCLSVAGEILTTMRTKRACDGKKARRQEGKSMMSLVVEPKIAMKRRFWP